MRALVWVGLALAASGCSTVQEVFSGAAPEAVWTALVAVAETPDYGDLDPSKRWFVRENHVRADETTRTIEIYRELDRVLHRPRTQPLREQQTWRFRVVMVADAPPTVTFISRGLGVPMKAVAEGDRYFADVRNLLAGTRPAAGAPPDVDGDDR